MARPLRIVCTGDLHIGRRPSRLPPSVDARDCSCAAVWSDIVAFAIERQVDAVLISGDLVDRENRFYEAFGPLEHGLRQLDIAGIDAVAVAGNHDFDVLPRLADQFDSGRFRLLGRDGRWERVVIQREGHDVLRVDGWSFPSEAVLTSPLRDFASWRSSLPKTLTDSDVEAAVPVIGLLHCDLDAPSSRYAPVSLADLRAPDTALWLLGHIHQHKLQQIPNGPAILYPGSPQAMDPGECGAHGPWLIELGEGVRRIRPVHVPLSKVRYDRVDVDVSGVYTEQALQTRLSTAVRDHGRSFCESCGPLRHASLRLRLIGRTALHRRLGACCEDVCDQLEARIGDYVVRVERIEFDTRPPVDLNELSTGNDAAAMLARLLLSVEQSGGDSATSLLACDAQRRMGDVFDAASYRAIASDGPPDGAYAREALRRQAYLLLDELLAQREEAEEGVAT